MSSEPAYVRYPMRVLGGMLLVYILAYIGAAPALTFTTMWLPVPVRLFGAALALGVIPILIVWAQRNLGKNVSPTVTTEEEQELITTGPYRWVRHPLYSIGALFYVSLALISGSWLLLVLFAMMFVLLVIRTRIEEAELERRFGQLYTRYRSRTGRFLPRIRTRQKSVMR